MQAHETVCSHTRACVKTAHACIMPQQCERNAQMRSMCCASGSDGNAASECCCPLAERGVNVFIRRVRVCVCVCVLERVRVYTCACICVRCVCEYASRAQPLQLGCSSRVTRCLGALVPANGCRLVLTNTMTVLVTGSDIVQCYGMSLGGSKLVPPHCFSEVSSNAKAIGVHVAKAALCFIKALRCS